MYEKKQNKGRGAKGTKTLQKLSTNNNTPRRNKHTFIATLAIKKNTYDTGFGGLVAICLISGDNNTRNHRLGASPCLSLSHYCTGETRSIP